MTKGLAMCDKCDYFISVEEAYLQGKADAENGYNVGFADGYLDGHADAEKEFQNSDYWNDYLAKVIASARADGKAEVIDEVVRTLAKSEDTILSDKQYYTLQQLKEQK